MVRPCRSLSAAAFTDDVVGSVTSQRAHRLGRPSITVETVTGYLAVKSRAENGNDADDNRDNADRSIATNQRLII